MINLIITAIISGIIIDNFADMRAEREFIDDNNNDFCFICNLEREQFERNQINFDKHQNEEHPKHQYCWLKIYIKNKSWTEFTGLESYIWDQIQQGERQYIPLFKSLSLQIKEEEGQSKDQQLLDVKEAILMEIFQLKKELYQLVPEENKRINPAYMRWASILNRTNISLQAQTGKGSQDILQSSPQKFRLTQSQSLQPQCLQTFEISPQKQSKIISEPLEEEEEEEKEHDEEEQE